MKSSLHQIEHIRLDLTPVELAKRCRHLPGLIFFDSALPDGIENRISIVAACPSEVVTGSTAADWEELRSKLKACEELSNPSSLAEPTDFAPPSGESKEPGCRFPRGMAAGYIEYDGRFTFGFYPGLLVYEHSTQCWERVGPADWSLPFEERGIQRSEVRSQRSEIGNRRSEAGNQRSKAGALEPLLTSDLRPLTSLPFAPTISRDDFCRMVQRAKAYISAGDIYQVNLSQRFTAGWKSDIWQFYERLRHYSAAPHASYVDLGGKVLLSSSPELFLRMSGSRILTRPIKGTRPRFADPLADEQSAFELITSPKEIAELVMITDLERNDLGRNCEFGSVTVTELLKLEKFAQVFHLVSTIEGGLRTGVDHVTALQGCFPGGSITGAPKKRAMEIIHELEPVPRGIYTGAIGYFGFNGESQFSIAIRTVAIENDQAQFHVGAGIVADSDPELEYEETLHKAAGILIAASQM